MGEADGVELGGVGAEIGENGFARRHWSGEIVLWVVAESSMPRSSAMARTDGAPGVTCHLHPGETELVGRPTPAYPSRFPRLFSDSLPA